MLEHKAAENRGATLRRHRGSLSQRQDRAPRKACSSSPAPSTARASAKEGNTVADSSAGSAGTQDVGRSTAATTDYLGERWCFLDCPVPVELAQEARNALMVADVAIVVAEPLIDKALMLAPTLEIPRRSSDSRISCSSTRWMCRGASVREMMDALQAASRRGPLVLAPGTRSAVQARTAGEVTGYVDLVSERAIKYHPGQESDLVKMPEDSAAARTGSTRHACWSRWPISTTTLMEHMLSDAVPTKEAIYQQPSQPTSSADLIVPVPMGSAEKDCGVRRLLKALRREVPEPEATAERLGLDGEQRRRRPRCSRPITSPIAGKLSQARVFAGQIGDSQTLEPPTHRRAC